MPSRSSRASMSVSRLPRRVGHADHDDQPAAVGPPGEGAEVARLAEPPGRAGLHVHQADLRIQPALGGALVQDGQGLAVGGQHGEQRESGGELFPAQPSILAGLQVDLVEAERGVARRARAR